MIIPPRCMNCGKVIGDKWRYYQSRLRELKAEKAETPVFIDGTQAEMTPEGHVLNEMGVKRSCCRKHFLTHKDLMDKI